MYETIATPASVLAVDPPVTVSTVSEKLPENRSLTRAPEGSVTSSSVAVKELEPDATGASLTAVTLNGTSN